MERILLLNLAFVAFGDIRSKDFLVWIPVAVQPWPFLAFASHVAVTIVALVELANETTTGVVLPIALSVTAPLVYKKGYNA